MQRSAAWTPPIAHTVAVPRWGAWLRRAWQQFTLDADERFLRSAGDLADLERRLRRLERGRDQRFAQLHPGA